MNLSITKTLFVLVMCCYATHAISQSKDEKAIREVMEKEIEYWNSGNIDGYVSLYAPVDSVRMIYTQGATYGRDSILAFYKKYWPKE